MTTAEKIVSELNAYEAAHKDGESNIWQDVMPHTLIDHAATEAADPHGQSTVAVFLDGSEVYYREENARWYATLHETEGE